MSPSSERATLLPRSSPIASPSMLFPTWIHWPRISLKALTVPVELVSIPLTAMVIPSREMATSDPKLLPSNAPSISSPICTQTFSFKEKARTCPESTPFPSFLKAPTTSVDLSPERAMEYPD